MQTEIVSDNIDDIKAVLTLPQVKRYADLRVDAGQAEYNKGSILMISKHPMDQCLRRGIIEDQHHATAKVLRTYRDCANSALLGRVFNAGGGEDSGLDPATIYTRVTRILMKAPYRDHWNRVAIICFTEPNIDGDYLNEAEYTYLLKIAGNIQASFEIVDDIIFEQREKLKAQLEQEEKKNG